MTFNLRQVPWRAVCKGGGVLHAALEHTAGDQVGLALGGGTTTE